MQKKLITALIATCFVAAANAQTKDQNPNKTTTDQDESAFTFTEAQLGEDDEMNQNVTIINSNNNFYANNVGYLFSPVRFRYRAYNQKYNDIYINGALMNNAETGQFNYSMIGGLNNQTRDMENALPFESNDFSVAGIGGSDNYNFRASNMPAGNRVTISGANRTYTLRAMYTYSTGIMKNGWAFTGSLSYRWANRGYVKGTFYNSLSYFFGAEKIINDQHRISFATWGNPTERGMQGGATDENYWLANSNYYNPYWGYQNGKIRNSRIVNDFAPTALFTWDWKINKTMKLTTTLSGKYAAYSSTKLNYSNSENPQPDYWKNMPSSFYDVWNVNDVNNRTAQDLADWNTAYNYMTASEYNRQIQWDKLYYANSQISKLGGDAMYYIQAKHNNQLAINLSSSLRVNLNNFSVGNVGVNLSTNKGYHYLTMSDLLGATTFHNINTYAIGTYPSNSDQVQYDLNNPNGVVKEGDKFGYNYNMLVDKADAWMGYTIDKGRFHTFINGKIGGTSMQRDGKMRNGLAPNNSYGKSGTAHFLDGGGKVGTNINLGRGNTILLGAGYEWKAPLASTAFSSPEVNNDFVKNLVCEKVFSSEIGYALETTWVHANINGYYNHIQDGTEWQNFYFDDINSFSYVSMTNIKKAYYGIEAGLNFKVSSVLNIKAIATMSDAKYINNSDVTYMNSTKGTYTNDIVMNKNMRESGTPLSAYSLGISYHKAGWYLDLNGNYYDRIYLSYPPCFLYQKSLITMGRVDNEGNFNVPDQSRGNGGFMLDANIGKSINLKKGSLAINLTLDNILNNTNICTGGYEQSRSDYTVNSTTGAYNNERAYKFSQNPKKFYALGFNGMLNISYKF